MHIDALETVEIGGMTQWIRVRAMEAATPVLLLMQQGPGFPIINEVRTYERLLGLEKEFTVVYWDQRGTGLSSASLVKSAERFEISATLMVDDAVSLLELLRNRFGGRTLVAGFSFGATFAAQAAVRRPDLVAAVIATAMDIDVPFAEQFTYDFARATARQRGNRRAIRQLEKIGPPPHVTTKGFATRARWAMNFGGVTAHKTYPDLARALLISMIRSPDYSMVDIVRTLRGSTASQNALLPELASTDLVRTMPSLEVPIVLAQGRLDKVAPSEATQRFYDSLTAPSKRLVWFEQSAHTPQYDEPAKFRELLMDIRSSHLASL
jgi:pimeloyl-ACP methyl ester carboxylesterase